MKDIIVKTSTIRELCQASIDRVNEYAERVEAVEKARRKEAEDHIKPELDAAWELYNLQNRNMFSMPDMPIRRRMRYTLYETSPMGDMLDSLKEQEEQCFTGEEFLSMHPDYYAKLLKKGEIQVGDLTHWLTIDPEDWLHYHREKLKAWKKQEEEYQAEKERIKEEAKREREEKEKQRYERAKKFWEEQGDEEKPVGPPTVKVEPVPLPSPWWIMVGALVFVAALVAGTMGA